MNETDEELVRRHLLGDQEAFPALVQRHLRAVYNLAYRSTGDAMEAENIAQETFVRAYMALPRSQMPSSFKAWLFTIAVNLCRNRARRARREPLTAAAAGRAGGEAAVEQVADPGPGPLQVLLADEANQALEKAVAALPLPYRQVIVLRYIEELSYEELAQTLGLPLNTVRTHLWRAKEHLRQALTRLQERQSDGLPRDSAALGSVRGGGAELNPGATDPRPPRPVLGLPE